MKKLVVWICNGVVALMAILAIICYFFAPVWKIKVKYPLTAEQLNDMVASSLSEYDITIEQGADINLDIDIDMGLLFSSVGSGGEATVQKLVEKNVDKLALQLKGTVGEITHTVAKQYAKQVVKDQVHAQLKNFLNTEDADHINQKLEAAGIDDSYISQKTDELFDLISKGNTSVDQITQEVMDTVDDVCSKLQNSGDEDLKDIKLNENDKQNIKDTVSDALDEFSSSDGTVNLDEYINNFLAKALRDMNSSKADGISLLAAQSGGDDELTQEIGNTILGLIPSELSPILSIVLIVALVLVLVSMLSWIYILVKLIVKLTKFSDENTDPKVKLKLPIILGWLPFLILAIVPSIAMQFLPGILQSQGADLAGLSISFGSIGWLALLSAGICLGISIYYMILRRQEKKATVLAISEEQIPAGENVPEEKFSEEEHLPEEQMTESNDSEDADDGEQD